MGLKTREFPGLGYKLLIFWSQSHLVLSLASRRGAPSGWKMHRLQNAPGSVGEAGHRGCLWCGQCLKSRNRWLMELWHPHQSAVGSEADVQHAQTCRRYKEERSPLLSWILNVFSELSLNIDYPSINHRNMQRTQTKFCEEQTLGVKSECSSKLCEVSLLFHVVFWHICIFTHVRGNLNKDNKNQHL